MSGHDRLVPGDYLDDPEVRAGYEEARRAIELGVMIRQLRMDAGLSQVELARRAGMTQPALSRLERGGGVPTITVLDRIASALHATLTVSMTPDLQHRAAFPDQQAVSLSPEQASDLQDAAGLESSPADRLGSLSTPVSRPQAHAEIARAWREDLAAVVQALQPTAQDTLAYHPDRAFLASLWTALKRVDAGEQATALVPGEFRSDVVALVREVDKRALRSGLPDHLAPGGDALRMAPTVRMLDLLRYPRDGDARRAGGPERTYAQPVEHDKQAREPSLPWEQVAEAHGRLVVLGAPGMGKSWLLRREVHRLASAALARLNDPEVVASDVAVPVLVQADALARAQGGTLPEAVADYLVSEEMLPTRSAGGVRELIAGGGVVLLVDALDEVPREATEAGGQVPRKRLEDLLRLWAEHCPRARVVVTSRPSGYTAPPVPGAQEAELLPFTSADIDAAVAAWDLPADAAESLRLWLGDPAMARMARTPLLLTLICSLAASPITGQADLPRSRAELYEAALQHMLSGRQDAPGHGEPTPALDVEGRGDLEALTYAAVGFADTPRGWVNRMPRHDLLNAVRRTRANPEKVLRRLVGPTGILVPADGEQDYGFLHRTFAEYLVARHLGELPADARMAMITEHQWFDPDWAEVFPMLGGLLARHGRRDAARALVTWFLDQEADPLHYAFRTALRILGDAPDPDSLLDRTQEHDLRAKITRLLTNDTTRRMLTATIADARTWPRPVTTALLGLLTDSDAGVRIMAARTLEGRDEPEVTTALLNCLTDQDASVRWAAAKALEGREGPEITVALLGVLTDPDAGVRIMAARTLEGRDEPEAATAFLGLLTYPDADVRQAAAKALEGPGEPEATAFLGLLTHHNPGVRAMAARALEGRDDVAILLKLTQSRSWPGQSGQLRERFYLASILAEQTYLHVPQADREQVLRRLDELTRQV